MVYDTYKLVLALDRSSKMLSVKKNKMVNTITTRPCSEALLTTVGKSTPMIITYELAYCQPQLFIYINKLINYSLRDEVKISVETIPNKAEGLNSNSSEIWHTKTEKPN